MGAALLFMLIGCSNVANLLLVRGVARRTEIAVRLAIGAPYGRIVRQLLTESSVLAVLGGVGAYLLTAAAWRILPAVAPVGIPRLAAARADSAILLFTLALAAINGILFGMAPALRLRARAARVRATATPKGATASALRSSWWKWRWPSCSWPGGQLLGSFARLVVTDPGFQADRILASVVLPAPERYREPERRGLFYRRILDAVRALPGVESAGTVDALPFSGENHGGFVSAGGGAGNAQMTAEIDVTGGDYLQAMGIQLMEGRWFREEEMSPSSDAVLVNQFVAHGLWQRASAVGQRICLYCTPENPNNWKRVIGVVSSASHQALNESRRGNVYLAAGAMRNSYFWWCAPIGPRVR